MRAPRPTRVHASALEVRRCAGRGSLAAPGGGAYQASHQEGRAQGGALIEYPENPGRALFDELVGGAVPSSCAQKDAGQQALTPSTFQPSLQGARARPQLCTVATDGRSRGVGPLAEMSAVFQAAFAGDVAALRAALVETSAPLEARDDTTGGTPLYAAAFHGHTACVALLLEAGCDARSEERRPPLPAPLWVAAANGHR